MISIVIPVLDEAGSLPILLAALAAETERHEVIVVDGGSSDGSVELARCAGALVLKAVRGRGSQLARGASAVGGDTILFLHADTRFPRGGLAALRAALADAPEAIGGNFRLLFDGADRFSRWLEGFYAWIRARGFYYGDSGIFIRRTALDALGGVRPVPVMEDYDLVRRMARAGRTICVIEPPLTTSSRRFTGRRPVAIVWGWLWLHLLFHLGVSPDRLSAIYEGRPR
jgi:rSAM/selenodomain-associated transferase 2